ncbi:hypothetical protein BDN70DRAFT_872547 [Pholiota conissans]|uniref:Mediator of RNA polymerase II transcription subunit 12 n=1 Tax=Pholiota conissans TaxID=109636 RepID=A0A9P5ZCB6_9AGAR|nr:hypothetical protein BDN70DRAFT_872547 [Pholiota conissans]
MRETTDGVKIELPAYESHPPSWLPKIHGSADLGYAGFHPPRPGQAEDVLSDSNVKNGYILGQAVSVETFSAQTMINESLNSPDALTKLEQLMNEVFVHRADRMPALPAPTFRIPTRVTLNDAKRQSWFADLANPDVPLYKLKSVPHGAKGHDLLDLLQSNNVEISRAVWFLRVFGANETAGLRNKPTYVPTQYSIDWANVVTGYMKKQLIEIALPSAPRPGLNIKQTFKGVLADVDTRERWISRFTYCLKLLRTFYAEDLVDHKTFLMWLIQQMTTCNLAQAGFLTRLADEYMSDILLTRALARPLAEACLAKLSEIRTSAHEFLKDTEDLLKVLIQRICLTLPDALVSPKMWSTYSALLAEVVHESPPQSLSLDDHFIDQSSRELRYILSENFTDIRRRNEAMLFRGPITQVSARLGAAVADVKLLNSLSSDTDMNAVPYFTHGLSDAKFKEKLDMLLTWSVTPLQYGDHRTFAAVTLIRIWRDKACDRASRRGMATPSEFLQDQLFDWLDTSEVAGEAINIRDVALLYGKLIKHEIFSYASYIQRLIARGEMGLSYADELESRHRLFLSWIPLFNSTSSLTHQRKVILHGARARETPEDLTEREIRKEIRSVLPDLFEGISPFSWTSTTSLLARCQTLIKATRFEQVRTFRQWLLPVFKRSLAKINADYALLFKSYLVAVELMTGAKCFHSMLDLTVCMLEQCNDTESMSSLIGIFDRYAAIWNCMDVMPTIVKSLDATHQVWKHRGVQSRPLLARLMKFDNGRHLPGSSRDRITSDRAAFSLALQPNAAHPDSVPEVLPEILLLAGDPEPNAPSILANGLWIKYRASLDWAWKVWDNAVASLRQIPSMSTDVEVRRACALRYGSFLWRVDQHLPNGLDYDVLQWFLGPGKAEVIALNADAWDILEVVLLFLVVHGSLKTTTILEGLIYPAWRLGTTDIPGQSSIFETYISSANNLTFHLLLQEDEDDPSMPPFNLAERQSIRTRRQAVYEEPHFSLLVESIPVLIYLENNENIMENLRTECTTLRYRICQETGFRQGAYRNLDIIRETFENSPYLIDQDPSSETLSKRAITGLRMVLCDSMDEANIYDWPEETCLLSPWKLASTTIQMQLQVKKLGRALSHESTAEGAAASLNKLTSMLFHHTKTAEEAYYVGEMARGADSTVACKFVNNGFQYIADHFPLADSDRNGDCLRRVGELLRVLIHVSRPFKESPAMLLAVEPQVLESFLELLAAKFKDMEPHLLNGSLTLVIRQNFILLSRLLQFALSFKNTWTAKSKEICINLSSVIFQFALYSAGEDNVDVNIYPILIDTLFLLYDELPNDSKSITFDAYRYYPNISMHDITMEIPAEYRKQICSLLVQSPSQSVVTNLLNTTRDVEGNTVYGAPVANKPWEWIEHLGESAALDPREDEREREEKERLRLKHLVKNSGSVSLDHFSTRLTSDGVKQSMLDDAEGQSEARLRFFEDGMSENIFIRDWRETRWDAEPVLHAVHRLHGEVDGETIHISDLGKAQALRASPALSTISHSSTQGTMSSLRQQHQQSPNSRLSNSAFDVIDVDSLPATSAMGKDSLKRKAAVAVSDDDEIEIIEGPVAINASHLSKKQRAGKDPSTAKEKARKK